LTTVLRYKGAVVISGFPELAAAFFRLLLLRYQDEALRER